MSTLLLVNSSILGDHSISAQLAESFSQQWLAANPGGTVMTRDVAEEQVPHLDNELVNAIRFVEPEQRNEKQQQQAAYSDQLINEVKSADAIVITAPMYNFGVPSQLKSWMDQLARPGISFSYGANGPEGLLGGKPVYVITTRGGIYHANGIDYITPFMQQFLGFLGFDEVNFIYAEGLNMGDEKEKGMQNAEEKINQLLSNKAA